MSVLFYDFPILATKVIGVYMCGWCALKGIKWGREGLFLVGKPTVLVGAWE